MANVLTLGTVSATNVNPYRIDKRIGSGEDEDIFYHLGTALDTTSWSNPHGTYVSTTVDATPTAGGVANYTDRSETQDIRINDNDIPFIIKFEFLLNYEVDLASYEFWYDSPTDAAPRDWTVEGSNDDTNWDYLHSVSDDIPTASNEKRHFFIVNLKNTFYKYIRFRITDHNGNSTYCAINEIYMWGALRNDTTGVAGTRIPGDLVSNFTDVDTYRRLSGDAR